MNRKIRVIDNSEPSTYSSNQLIRNSYGLNFYECRNEKWGMQQFWKIASKMLFSMLENVLRNENFSKMWHVKGGNSYKTRYLFVSRGIL